MAVKGGDVIFNFKSDDKELQKSVDNMGSSIKKMVAALGIDKLISKTMSALNNSLDGAIKRIDTMNNFPRVMQNLGISVEDATKSVNELSDGLTGLPTTLNDGVSAVQRFTSQNGDVKKSTKIFLALNNAILAGGASTEIQASALEQLSQAYRCDGVAFNVNCNASSIKTSGISNGLYFKCSWWRFLRCNQGWNSIYG